MFGLLRLFLIIFAVLTLIYVCLSLYARAVRRDKLEAEWEMKKDTIDRQRYVSEGLQRYDGSLRRKLLLGVYVIPAVLIATIIYLTNYA